MRIQSQSGNMLLMLFGAIAVAGVITTGYMATMKGPGRALSEASKETSIENALLAATRLVIAGDAAHADCDGDGAVEPLPFRAGAGPVGGGLVPLESGAVKNDPWGKALGYCVWDHGKKSKSDNIASCGGSSVNRLQGGNISTEIVLAIVSAGKDGIFQTTCNAWTDANTDKIADTPLIITSGDDIVRRDTIETLLSSGVLTQLPSLPDSACIAGAEGTMRFENGVPQVCTSTGWKEVGGASGSSNNFTNTGLVNPSTPQTSNALTMSGYFGTRKVTVDNGAVLIVNGEEKGSSYDVPVGATVAIKGTAAPFASPATSTATNPKTFTLEVGSTTKTWVVTTRSRTAPSFTVTPSPSNMNVTGPAGTTASTAYSSAVQFTVTNNGEATSAAINALSFSNATNFESTGTNLCTGAALAQSGTCTFYARAKATQPSSPNNSGTVTVSATGATSGVANLTSTATGWGCTHLAWAGTIANPGSVTAYQFSTAATCNGACPSQSRTCSGSSSLSGSYTYQSCNPLATCTYSWQTGAWGGCSVSCGGGTQTRSVWCLRSDGTTVGDASCGGGRPADTQSCNTGACPDTTPDAFSFTNQTNVVRSTVINSNIEQITGINVATNISIGPTSADFRICSNSSCSSVVSGWNNTTRTVTNGQYVQIRRTSSSSDNTTSNTTLTVGTYSTTWQITTVDCTINGPRYDNSPWYVWRVEPGTSEGECGCTKVMWNDTQVGYIGDWSTTTYTTGGYTYTRGTMHHQDETSGGRTTNFYYISRVKSACN